MNAKSASVLMILLLSSGCGMSDAPSQKKIQDLITQARVEAAAGQLKDAEQKLLQCVDHSGKNILLRLTSLNELIDVELQLHNDSKAKTLIKEAGGYGEALSSAGAEPPGAIDAQLLEEARKAVIRWADSYAELGSYDSARTLYEKAQIIEQRTGQIIQPGNSAQSRLEKLKERMRGEKHALESAQGLENENDPGYQARQERTAVRKKILEQFSELNRQMERKPSKQLADRMLALLPGILTTYGVREGEYRGTLHAAVQLSFLHGDRARALSLLKEDMAKFENISQESIEKADPTSVENADFMIADLAQLAALQMLIGEYVEAAKSAGRGIDIARRAHSPDTGALADCLKAVAVEKEQHKVRTESIPIRQQQIAMLKRLNLTDNYPPYYEAHLELGRTLAFDKRYKEALPHIDYAIGRLYANQQNEVMLPYALTAKGQLLFDSGDYAGARHALLKAQQLFEKKGSPEMKFSCHRFLSMCLRQMNLLKDAQKAGKSALACAQQMTKGRDQAISDSYQELANLDDYLGNSKYAIGYVKQALPYQAKTTGENSPPVVGMINYEATLEKRLGHFKEAEKLHLKAIAICRKQTSPDRTALISSLLQLANFYHGIKQTDKAEPLYREVLAMNKEQMSSDSLHFLRMSSVQLAINLCHKDTKEAEKLKDQAIAKLPNSSSEKPLLDCNYYASLGDLCLILHDYRNAEAVYDKFAKAYEKSGLAVSENRRALGDLKEILLTRRRDLYKATKRENLAKDMSSSSSAGKNGQKPLK